MWLKEVAMELKDAVRYAVVFFIVWSFFAVLIYAILQITLAQSYGFAFFISIVYVTEFLNFS